MEEKTGMFESLEAARNFFRQDRYATESGIGIEELSPGRSVCSFELTKHHRNAMGGVMGGAVFTLVDFAFATAASAVHMPTVAMQVSVNFLSAPRGKKLTAVAECRKDGRTSCVYNINVSDDAGTDVAQAVMTGFKMQRR